MLCNLLLHSHLQLIQLLILNLLRLLPNNLVDLRLYLSNLVLLVLDLHHNFLNLLEATRLIGLCNLGLHLFLALLVHVRELHILLR